MADYGPIYEGAGRQFNVDPALLSAIVQTESGGDPNAVSPKGAVGAAQLLPQTAASLGVQDPTDPQQAIYGAAKLLSQNLDRYGNVDDAIRAYHGGTDKANWGPKTDAYHCKVMGLYSPQISDEDLEKAFTSSGAPASAAGISDDDLVKAFAGGSAPAPTTPQGAPAKPGDTSGFNIPEKLGTGLLYGVDTAFRTVGNALDAPARVLENTFGPITLGGALPTVAQGDAQRAAIRDSYNRQFGSSTAATIGNVIGQTAATAPLIAAAPAALAEASPVAASYLGAGMNTLRALPVAGPLAANALVGATQGAATAALTSAGSDKPLGEQLKQGAEVGGVLGAAAPVVSGAARKAYNLLTGGAAVSPLAAQLAGKAVNDYDIPLRGSQITDSPFVKRLDTLLSKVPFSGMHSSDEAINSSFTRAASNTIGADADALTGNVVQQAKQAIGAKFDKVAASTTIKADNQFLNDLSAVESDARQVITEGEFKPIQNQIDNVISKVGPNGEITGEAYQALTRKGTPLDRAIESDNPNISFYASKIKDSLNDALTRSAPPDMQSLLTEAKYQWKNYVTLKPLIEKAQEGRLSPALLLNRVRQVYGDVDTGGGGDLGDLARIGQRFLKQSSSSGTAENLGIGGLLAEGGAAVAHPALLGKLVAGTAGSLGAGRLASSALRSDWYRNLLLNAGTAPAVPSATNMLLQKALQQGGVPAAVITRQALTPSLGYAP